MCTTGCGPCCADGLLDPLAWHRVGREVPRGAPRIKVRRERLAATGRLLRGEALVLQWDKRRHVVVVPEPVDQIES
jgi:hypothetical protein